MRRMTIFRFSLLFPVVLGLTASFFGIEARRKAVTVKATTELYAKVAGIKYCSDSSVSMSLELSFVNTGSRAIIVNRLLPEIYAFRIAKNLKKLRSGTFEREGKMQLQSVGSPPVTDEPDSTYSIIEPGQSLTLLKELKISDVASVSENCEGDDCLKPGPHFLQVDVNSWGLSADLAGKLAARWRSRGELFTQTLTSFPVKFVVESPSGRKSEKCDK